MVDGREGRDGLEDDKKERSRSLRGYLDQRAVGEQSGLGLLQPIHRFLVLVFQAVEFLVGALDLLGQLGGATACLDLFLQALGPLAELLSRPRILYTTALATMGAFTWQATASFLPTFLDVGSGLSTALSALLFSLYFLVHGGTQPVTGSLSDRFGRDATAMGTMSAGVVGYGLLVATARFDLGLGPTVAAVCLVGVAMSWGAPVQSRFMDLLSDAERGAGFGLVRTAYMVLGASGSVVVGTVSDAAGWGAAFGLLAGVMALGLGTLLANRLLGLGY